MPFPHEPVEAVDAEAPPGDAAGEDDRAGAQHVAAVEVHVARRGVDPGDRPGDEDLRPEPAGLLQRPARQLVAGHAGREPEVVLDPRGRAGLTAGSLALDDDRPQPLRGAVHRRGEARRAPRRRSPRRTRQRAGSVVRPSSSATRRSCGRTTVFPSDDPDRRAGRSGPGAGLPTAPPRRGRPSVSQRNAIWLRSRKCRSSVHAASPAVADDERARRGRLRRDALQAADPPRGAQRRRRSRRRRAPRPRRVVVAAPRCASRADGSAARKPTGNAVPRVIGTSPNEVPGVAARRRCARSRRRA